uniref:tRNA (guanine(37)-N1)-methyltransferase n=1 Tax=Panagrellus redivivus TaxID=6233 RepID=A0A7E4W270_PANRE
MIAPGYLLRSIRTTFTMVSKIASDSRKLLLPPDDVRGMTELDREKFRSTIQFPSIQISKKLIGRVVGSPGIKNYTIDKLSAIKPISDGPTPETKVILFDPAALTPEIRFSILDGLEKVTSEKFEFGTTDIQLTYDHWDIKRAIKAILPDGLEFHGYSQVGHIAHLNLREEMLPFKKIIGQLLVDKVSWVKTVVNKTDSIATEFRSFDMELLAGEPIYETQMVEQGVTYKLDFRKVFWNSRLGTEHARIVKKLDKNSVVFDIFAGVGPFAIPAVKKGVKAVFANDKNPNSTHYMAENVKLNHLSLAPIKIYTLDATDFIRDVIGPNILTSHSEATPEEQLTFHSIMNLPAIAVDFLHDFRGLLHGSGANFEELKRHQFIVHCHMFVKAKEDVKQEWYAVEAERIVHSKLKLWHVKFDEVHNVRKVAGRKEMYCVSVTLPWEYLFEKVPNGI